MAQVARLYRHPIKGIGAEALDRTVAEAGRCLPGDRVWAVAHEAAKLTDDGWSRCMNFVRGAKSPALMAVTARLEPGGQPPGPPGIFTDSEVQAGGRVTLSHPDRPEITLDPDREPETLIDWVRPLCDPDRAAPARVVRAGRGMTDSEFESIAILCLASLRVLEGRAGRPLDPRRFRGNIWLDGLAPWQEFEWVGRRLRIGDVDFEVRARITRCVATHADPATGRPDTDILGLLESGWDHGDFGVYAVALSSGEIATGEKVDTP